MNAGPKRDLFTAIARVSLAVMLLGAVIGGAVTTVLPSSVAFADDDDDDDFDDDDDYGGGHEVLDVGAGTGNAQGQDSSGNQSKGQEKDKKDKDKKDKKDDDGADRRGKDKGKRGADGDVVVVAPDVTPISVIVQPTVMPEAEQVGSLRVITMNCPAMPAADDDWQVACSEPVNGARFELKAIDGPFAEWHRLIDADESGEANLDPLPIARYQLEQRNHQWCRAESDRVDENGDLVIESGAVTTVWVFNCGLEFK